MRSVQHDLHRPKETKRELVQEIEGVTRTEGRIKLLLVIVFGSSSVDHLHRPNRPTGAV